MQPTAEMQPTTGQTVANPSLERMDPVPTILIGIVTLGIWPLVRFINAGQQYERLLPGREARVVNLILAYVGTAVLGGLLSGIIIGLLLLPVSIWLGWKALTEMLEMRAEVMRRYGLQSQVQGLSNHRTLWLVGQLLGWTIIGLIPAFMQMYWFFNEHTALADELQQRKAQPTGLG